MRQARKIKFTHSGFTMIEMILTLAIFAFLQTGLSQALHFGMDYYQSLTNETADDWANFILYLGREIRPAALIKVTDHALTYRNEGIGDIIIEYYHNKYGGMLRRRVRYSGHQPILTNIKDVQMERIANDAVRISCQFDDGKERAFTFYTLLERNETSRDEKVL